MEGATRDWKIERLGMSWWRGYGHWGTKCRRGRIGKEEQQNIKAMMVRCCKNICTFRQDGLASLAGENYKTQEKLWDMKGEIIQKTKIS